MKLTRLKQNLQFPWKLAIALGSGILMGLTPAPFNVWWLAWVALAPLWVLVFGAPENDGGRVESSSFKSPVPIVPRTALLYGAAWGIGYHGLALFWITGIHPMTWMGVNWWASLAIAAFAWSFITLCGAAIPVLWAWLMLQLHRLWHTIGQVKSTSSSASPPISPTPLPSWLRVLMGTALWCLLENLWSKGSLYWSSLSYTQSPYNLAILHLGQLSGPLLVTAVIVSVNGLLAEAWIKRVQDQALGMGDRWLRWGVPIAWGGLCHLVGVWLYLQPLADLPQMALTVGVIQGNIPNTIKLYEDGWQRSLTNYTTGYLTLVDQGVEVILTPETALPVQWLGEMRKRILFYKAVVEKGIPVWLGAFGGDGRYLTNSLFTVAGNGETLSEYRKVKLVPLGEYIPFEKWLGSVINRLSPLEAHLLPGQPDQLFDTPFGRAIAAICYESAFSEIFRYQAAAGGAFILTASNNAHYSTTMPAQHHAQDVMRAIETDRWAARATNTGYSAFIDPHGKTVWISGVNTYETHAETIYRRHSQTFYVRWGDWSTPVIAAIAILAYGGSMVISTRRLR